MIDPHPRDHAIVIAPLVLLAVVRVRGWSTPVLATDLVRRRIIQLFESRKT